MPIPSIFLGFSGRPIRPVLLAMCLAASAPDTTAFAAGKPGEDAAAAARQAAAALLKVAQAEYNAGQFDKAAGHFLTCFEVDAKNMSCLFNAARSEQRIFQLEKAEAHYQTYLQLEQVDQAGRKRAQVHLEEIREVRAQLRKQATDAPGPAAKLPGQTEVAEPAPSPEQVGKPTEAGKPAAAGPTAGPAPRPEATLRVPATGPEAPSGTPAITAWVAGGALVATGAVLWLTASGAQRDLDADLTKKQGDLIVGVRYADYQARQNSINRKVLVGDVAAVIGAATVGVGTWLWLGSRPAKSAAPAVTAAVAPDGATLLACWTF